MKLLRPLLLGLVIASRAPAAQAPVNSTLTAATVYGDRAVVTRSATVDLPAGTSELQFANLPESLDERSLQVSGKGTAQALILDVTARQTFVDFTPNARVKELEDALHGLRKEERGLNDRAAVLQSQGTMLDRMEAALFAPPAKDVPRPELAQFTNSLTFLSEQKSRIVAERASLDDLREALQNRIATAERQLNELRGAGGRGYKTVVVRVSAPQPGSLDLALSYAVPGASWAPSYDARVASSERVVSLAYFGIVRQNTGEDWKDVALTLSTARPGLGGAAPVLSVWNVDVLTMRPMDVVTLNSFQIKDAGRLERNKAQGGAVNMQSLTSNAPAPEFDAALAEATIEAGATSASFRIATTATIPSDNSPQKVPINSARLTATPEYLTAPKRLATAYLTAKVVNSSDFPLLAGTMNVFLDGTFVATSSLRTVMAGEKFDLALGADEGIAVKHRRVNKFTEDTGLTNSGKRVTYEYLITVQNNKRTAERVIVADQVPVSRNEKVVVKQISPDAKDVKPTNEGILKWTLALKAGEKRELTVKFAIEYANDVNVAGLE
ncbi:MAG: hypothetical protein JWM88_2510 [Verrucomicrobia bacterium]|nr:hypothetical protein [Verrucomicrobiota bacterium]